MVFIVSGILGIVLSILVAVLTLVVGFRLLSVFTREYDDEIEIRNNNVAVAVISAMFLICVGLALKTAAHPCMILLNRMLKGPVDAAAAGKTLGMVALILGAGAVLSMLSLFFSMFMMRKLSPFKDLSGVMRNNVAIAIIIAAVMLVTTLLLTEPLLFLLLSFLDGGQPALPIPR